jgi:hypothetical protein
MERDTRDRVSIDTPAKSVAGKGHNKSGGHNPLQDKWHLDPRPSRLCQSPTPHRPRV